ncbi:MAG: hypothetical protein ABIO84_07895 [Lysobacter sp.]
MSQNLFSQHPTGQQWAAVDAALQAIEDNLPALVALSPTEIGRLYKMGDKSEAFCRLSLEVMTNNPGVLARDFDVEEMRRDLAAHDALRARSVRLQKLAEKLRGTDIALGSDIINAALEGYGMLKVAGKGEGLLSLRRALSARFDRSSSGPPAEVPRPVPMDESA